MLLLKEPLALRALSSNLTIYSNVIKDLDIFKHYINFTQNHLPEKVSIPNTFLKATTLEGGKPIHDSGFTFELSTSPLDPRPESFQEFEPLFSLFFDEAQKITKSSLKPNRIAVVKGDNLYGRSPWLDFSKIPGITGSCYAFTDSHLDSIFAKGRSSFCQNTPAFPGDGFRFSVDAPNPTTLCFEPRKGAFRILFVYHAEPNKDAHLRGRSSPLYWRILSPFSELATRNANTNLYC